MFLQWGSCFLLVIALAAQESIAATTTSMCHRGCVGVVNLGVACPSLEPHTLKVGTSWGCVPFLGATYFKGREFEAAGAPVSEETDGRIKEAMVMKVEQESRPSLLGKRIETSKFFSQHSGAGRVGGCGATGRGHLSG